ncbi:hypothetical protein EVAR_29150_1 [Eumeta japonica]|uniref:Uncharacterized protein n=1 Tax=Eumeta variegata TaxID=151549 RepID=A0A4C1VAZ3_EUMVA|nr:hypothetical protein EVAR_29150_1 [Eumeta japonica]
MDGLMDVLQQAPTRTEPVQDVKNDVSDANKKIYALESERVRLNKDISRLSQRLAAVEKAARRRNVEIQAVPEKRSENISRIFKRLLETVKQPILNREITAARRVAKMNPSLSCRRNVLSTFSFSRYHGNILSVVKKISKENSS